MNKSTCFGYKIISSKPFPKKTIAAFKRRVKAEHKAMMLQARNDLLNGFSEGMNPATWILNQLLRYEQPNAFRGYDLDLKPHKRKKP